MVNTANLSNYNNGILFIALPMRLDEDSAAIDICLEELQIIEINDSNFSEVYEKIKNLMYKKYPPASVPGWW